MESFINDVHQVQRRPICEREGAEQRLTVSGKGVEELLETEKMVVCDSNSMTLMHATLVFSVPTRPVICGMQEAIRPLNPSSNCSSQVPVAVPTVLVDAS
jgi:hypothetical protein